MTERLTATATARYLKKEMAVLVKRKNAVSKSNIPVELVWTLNRKLLALITGRRMIRDAFIFDLERAFKREGVVVKFGPKLNGIKVIVQPDMVQETYTPNAVKLALGLE